MIVVVAPYAPVERTPSPNLGAARKIEEVIRALSALDEPIVLVNSAHNEQSRRPLTCSRSCVAGIEITEITPPTFSRRQLGKLLNLLAARQLLDVVREVGTPSMVWLYNGYAFEAHMGRLLSLECGVPTILEFEDWHFSRGRGLNPKPIIDWLLWRRLLGHLSFGFAVNATLQDRLTAHGIETALLPGMVSPLLAARKHERRPFEDAVERIGYFGGLSVEKGADTVLGLVGRLLPHQQIVVTGSGALEEDFRQAALLHPEAIAFHGRVDSDHLVELILSCDVLLNPHSPIEHMVGGVFPFKVIESIASGRLLITTPVPDDGFETVTEGVQVVGTMEEMVAAIHGARKRYATCRQTIEKCSAEALDQFGPLAILPLVQRIRQQASEDGAIGLRDAARARRQ